MYIPGKLLDVERIELNIPEFPSNSHFVAQIPPTSCTPIIRLRRQGPGEESNAALGTGSFPPLPPWTYAHGQVQFPPPQCD